jgi:RNA polymerase sigma factor (sigma-70 family)
MQLPYRKAPVLLPDERARLYRLMKNGDMGAKNTLALSIIPWAIRYASRFVNAGLDHSDLMEIANYAVAESLNRWDPKRGALTSVAAWAVKSGVSLAKRRSGVATVPQKRLCGGLKDGDPILRLFHPRSLSTGCADLVQTLMAKPDHTADEEQEEQEWIATARAQVRSALERLSKPRYAHVLRRRWQGETLNVIANDMGVSKECIRQTQEKAMIELRQLLKHVDIRSTR